MKKSNRTQPNTLLVLSTFDSLFFVLFYCDNLFNTDEKFEPQERNTSTQKNQETFL